MVEETINQKIDKLIELQKQNDLPKKKRIKIPRKAKVSKRKAKKGWVGILKIDENNNISGERQQVDDSVYTLKGGTYHAMNGKELLRWEGKYPVILQHVKRLNPYDFTQEKNETFGQKLVVAKMFKDAIIKKAKGGAGTILWIVGIGVAIYLGYTLFTGGF